jgi:RNA polymerase sigma-70 factor (ECF subfamily)
MSGAAHKARTRSEAWLVLRAQSGDRQALDSLLRAVQHPLFRHLRGLTRNDADAAELLQETLMQIYRRLRTLREPTLFRPWCYRIATRAAYKLFQRQKKLVTTPGLDALADVEAPPPRKTLVHELGRDLHELVAEVSAASRSVLLLHYEEELTLREIAEVLGVSIGTVKSRLAYGIAALRTRWAD